ncbi:Ppx/GppA phosphatase family protein [Capillimicrobium parvum]|uniref:Exopolyphosphatase 2 n=1 Tax=Capillimicrobium parvum TaxID=2884022 RepID=A0A9E6XV57_9ACTN|nr:Ppx/GppA phosphatase family protein [Capillimicrobium parvum]UGS34688.1 Exopolyphosphatase 2 [Capillimicrobium parvum]
MSSSAPDPSPSRVAVVDVGTNSTRLLIADVGRNGAIAEIDRRSIVTRLGEDVDATARLADAAMERVLRVLAEYRAAIDAAGSPPARAVMTSAVRDAANGEAFAAEVAERFGFDAREISGDEEARLTFLGATSTRPQERPALVVDIGGGSTELVIGQGGELRFHVSTQAGVVRQSERHLHHDPPADHELQALTDDVRRVLNASVPHAMTYVPEAAIAVAGTATSLAAIDLELEPYDPARVEGHVLERATCEMLLARLAGMTLEERRRLRGLHPDRAPTIVAGAVLLVEALRLFRLQEVEVSEHDLLYGAALATVRR